MKEIKPRHFIMGGVLIALCSAWASWFIASVVIFPQKILLFFTLLSGGILIALVRSEYKVLKGFLLILVAAVVFLGFGLPSMVFSVRFQNLTDKNLSVLCTDIDSSRTTRVSALPGETVKVVFGRGDREQFTKKVIILFVTDPEGNIYHQEAVRLGGLEPGKLIVVRSPNSITKRSDE